MLQVFLFSGVDARQKDSDTDKVTVMIPLDEPYMYYSRLLQLSGQMSSPVSMMLRPVHVRVSADNIHPWSQLIGNQPLWENKKWFAGVDLIHPAYFSSYNSALPAGGNDGVLWQGRGLNQSVTAGLKAQLGVFHVQLKPVVTSSQNLDFELSKINRGTFESPYLGYVQRFGSETLNEINWGDSYAGVRLLGLEGVAGYERLWTGPSTTYPMLFGSNAPGFLHGRVGTYRPLNVWVGHVEGHYVFGKLESSEFSSIHTRSLNMLMASFSPRWIPGLSLGAERLFVDYYPDNLTDLIFHDNLFQVFWKYILDDEDTGGDGSEPDNQILSLFGRWAFPAMQFELYGTYSINDHRTDARDFRMHPDHAAYWNFGLIKLFERSDREWIAVNLEITELEDTRTSIARGWPNPNRWASIALTNHSSNPLNHRGTPLGSMLGPGGNALMLKVDSYSPGGRWSVRANRHLYMNALLHNSALGSFSRFQSIQPSNPNVTAQDVRQVEFQLALEATRFLPWYGLELGGGLEFTQRMNHNFIYKNDIGNWRFFMTIRKRLPGRGW